MKRRDFIQKTMTAAAGTALVSLYTPSFVSAGDVWQPGDHGIPIVDLSQEVHRRVIVEQVPGQYLGQPDTVLLADEKTILVGYPDGHGHPNTVLKRSTDGGLTWSERLPVPDNFTEDHYAPTLHRVVDSAGVERLIIFVSYPRMILSVSEDNGETWSPFAPVFDEDLAGQPGFQGHAPPKSVVPVSGGRYLAMYHDHIQERPRITGLFQIISEDGGLRWSPPLQVGRHPRYPGANPCAPALIRSPAGSKLLCLIRALNTQYSAMVMVSDDEGETWSEMRELPTALKGVRHVARYAPDGRMVMTFRDFNTASPTHGDFVGWVGTYEDIIAGREGQYRLRLLDNKGQPGDTGYAGLEVLPDGMFVSTTYCRLEKDEAPLVVSVRYTLDEIDAKANQ